MAKQANDTQYTYAVAKIRAVEGRLLDRARLYRMAEAGSFEECLKLLQEAGYPAAEGGYEEMLRVQLTDTYAFLRGISPVKDTFDIFLIRSDYHNIKVLLKAEFLGKTYDHLLLETGRYAAARIKKAVAERSFSGLPDRMREAVTDALAAYDKSGDPQESDLILDRAAYQEMAELAQQSGSKYVCDIVAAMTDLANLRIFMRVKEMGRGYDFLSRALLPGGTLAPSAYLREVNLPLAELIAGTRYDKLDTQSITALEKAADNFLMESIKSAKYVAFGIEPLIAYLLAKENEIRQVRIILTGKKNGIPADTIKERLREAYV